MANKITTSTTVKLPSAAVNYTQGTQDPDLRSQIYTLLLKEGHVSKIHDHLLHCLHAHTSNWPSILQAHALSLLRSGEVATFPALLHRILDDVRRDSLTSTKCPASSTTGGPEAACGNGAGHANGKTATDGKGLGNASDHTPSLSVPKTVVEEALVVTRECLETVCELKEAEM